MMRDNNAIDYSQTDKKLRDDVKKLKVELSTLLLEQDELLFVQCKNIETIYMLNLGNLEYKIYELELILLRIKRKISIIQAKKNHQEVINQVAIESILDEEFEDYQQKLDEKINMMNIALERAKNTVLSEAETREIKQLYRMIVKSLHPDLNPNVSKAKVDLFKKAVEAYENGDLEQIKIISVMVEKPIIDNQETTIDQMLHEKNRLVDLINSLKEKILKIKNEFPYIMKPIVENEIKLTEKKQEMEQKIVDIKETIDDYKIYLEKILR